MNTQTAAEDGRDAGIAVVLENNQEWKGQITRFYEHWIAGKGSGFEFIGESFRQAALTAGLPKPRHPNAWGAVFHGLVKKCPLIRLTGRFAKMTTPKSHARKSFVYERI